MGLAEKARCTSVSTPAPPPATEPPAPSTTSAKPISTKTPAPKPTPDAPKFPATFKNPIKKGTNADPWIIFDKESDYYYYINVAGGGLKMRRSKDLTNWDFDGPVVWKAPKEYKNIWAPELHKIDGEWYIYVAMDDGQNKNHRMYVFKGTKKDPMKPFKLVGKISTSDDNWAIDGTVMQYRNGKNYFIWSGWSGSATGDNQNLYIAEMSSPTKLSSKRVLIHEPKSKWMRTGKMGINEGPTALEHNGRWFIVYSAAGSWSDNYSLALMGIDAGKNPMSRKNWWSLDDRPVMWKSDTAFGPGHASFTVDRKGTPYVIYHAMEKSGGGWGGRSVRAQPFGWNKDGSPSFPRPVGFNVSIPHPQ
ncbi:Arabinanase/levansucrase/invertase [Auricularia subglabra TFB-10046 SS5]|nr:Arabinanase/levansucrase/invertase [Auricularia subglabra TFB-10046 SS5]